MSLTRLSPSTSRRQTASGAPLRAACVELRLQPLVKVAVVPEAGEPVGERELSGDERRLHRPLVEGDGEQGADECQCEERRALPEHDEHERARGHDREREQRRARDRRDQRDERALLDARDRRRDEQDVDDVVGGGRRRDGSDELRDGVAFELRGDTTGGGCRERVDRAVVEQPERGMALGDVDRDPHRERDDGRLGGAEHHGRADEEDGRERDAAGRQAPEPNRRRLDEHACGEHCGERGPGRRRRRVEGERRQRGDGRREARERDGREQGQDPSERRSFVVLDVHVLLPRRRRTDRAVNEGPGDHPDE